MCVILLPLYLIIELSTNHHHMVVRILRLHHWQPLIMVSRGMLRWKCPMKWWSGLNQEICYLGILQCKLFRNFCGTEIMTLHNYVYKEDIISIVWCHLNVWSRRYKATPLEYCIWNKIWVDTVLQLENRCEAMSIAIFMHWECGKNCFSSWAFH